MDKFPTKEVFDALYHYYYRNCPSRPKEEIERVLREKCSVEWREENN